MKREKAIQNFDVEEIFNDGFRVRVWVNMKTREGEELMASMRAIKEFSDALKAIRNLGKRLAEEGAEDERQN